MVYYNFALKRFMFLFKNTRKMEIMLIITLNKKRLKVKFYLYPIINTSYDLRNNCERFRI